MTDATLPAHLAQIDDATLTPLVQRALERPTAVVLTWTCETLHDKPNHSPNWPRP